jgi:hypothetical protein
VLATGALKVYKGGAFHKQIFLDLESGATTMRANGSRIHDAYCQFLAGTLALLMCLPVTVRAQPAADPVDELREALRAGGQQFLDKDALQLRKTLLRTQRAAASVQRLAGACPIWERTFPAALTEYEHTDPAAIHGVPRGGHRHAIHDGELSTGLCEGAL